MLYKLVTPFLSLANAKPHNYIHIITILGEHLHHMQMEGVLIRAWRLPFEGSVKENVSKRTTIWKRDFKEPKFSDKASWNNDFPYHFAFIKFSHWSVLRLFRRSRCLNAFDGERWKIQRAESTYPVHPLGNVQKSYHRILRTSTSWHPSRRVGTYRPRLNCCPPLSSHFNMFNWRIGAALATPTAL